MHVEASGFDSQGAFDLGNFAWKRLVSRFGFTVRNVKLQTFNSYEMLSGRRSKCWKI